MKILILSSYYNRPVLVRNMLASVLAANEYHADWELSILDDNSPIPLEPILDKMMVGHMDKVRTANSGMSFQNKIEQGLALGRWANQGIRESDADIAIFLTDDDELVPTYLRDLSSYFANYPDVPYCYSHIHLFNPLCQKSSEVDCLGHKYNQWREPIDPVAKLDASQVAWRLSCCKEHGVWLKESTNEFADMPWVKDTDRSFFERLFNTFGAAPFSGLVGQYKGVHEHQLLWHKKTDEVGLREYYERINELGGKEF